MGCKMTRLFGRNFQIVNLQCAILDTDLRDYHEYAVGIKASTFTHIDLTLLNYFNIESKTDK